MDYFAVGSILKDVVFLFIHILPYLDKCLKPPSSFSWQSFFTFFAVFRNELFCGIEFLKSTERDGA